MYIRIYWSNLLIFKETYFDTVDYFKVNFNDVSVHTTW